jgi:hypothetical protein
VPRSTIDEQQFQPWDLLVDDQGNFLVTVDDPAAACRYNQPFLDPQKTYIRNVRKLCSLSDARLIERAFEQQPDWSISPSVSSPELAAIALEWSEQIRLSPDLEKNRRRGRPKALASRHGCRNSVDLAGPAKYRQPRTARSVAPAWPENLGYRRA